MPARAEKLAKDSAPRAPIKDAEQAMERCNELDAELAELKAMYDLYFQGVERLPPSKKHEAFKKHMAQVKGSFVRQTAAKFRIESISQKFVTYERLWDRTLKEIENGTFKRDLARMKRRNSRQETRKKDDAFDIDEDLDLSDLESESDGDDLASALAEAEAAVSKPAPVAPVVPVAAVPAIKPLVPSIAPAVTPAGGAPAAPKTGLAPTITPAGAPTGKTGLMPSITAAPAVAPVAKTGVAPSIAPAVKTGVVPAMTPAGGAPAAKTGVVPAMTPAGTPAARPATGMAPALKPAGATGSNPAMRPVSQPPQAAARPAAAGGGDGLSDQKIKAIYDAYVMAKKRCGEDTRAVTLDSVASSLRKQVPELMKSHKAKSVEFKVVIKDGKAVLRALPKEE